MVRRSGGKGGGPQGAGGRTPPREVIDRAHLAISTDALTQATTAAAMLREISGHTKDTVATLGRVETWLNDPANSMGGGGGSGTGDGGGTGASFSHGRPVMSEDQSRRPTTGPTGYPGGAGYGAHAVSHGFGYSPEGVSRGGMSGSLGAAQAYVSQFVHHRMGTSDAVNYRREENGSYTGVDRFGNDVEGQTGLSQSTVSQRVKVSQNAAIGGHSGSVLGALQGIPVVGPIASKLLTPFNEVQKVGNFIGDQRAANAQYQSIYGPGTSGFDQRMQNFGGRFNNTMRNIGSVFGIGNGGLSDSDYDTAFKSISGMGFQGGDRDRMLNFATNNFSSMGMSVQDSLSLVSTNAKEASTNFSTLTDQLKNVSTMAQEAGQSAEVFRQKFSQSYQTAVNSGFGSASGALATAQVANTAGQGRLFTGLNTSQMFSTMQGQTMLASQMGYTNTLDFSLASQANPMVTAQAQDKQLDQVFNSVVPQSVRQLVQQEIDKQPGGAQSVANDQGRAQIVVSAVEQKQPGAIGNNVYAIRQAMSAANIGIDQSVMDNPNALAIYYVQWVAKNGKGYSTAVAQQIAKSGQVTVGGAKASTNKKQNQATADTLNSLSSVFGGGTKAGAYSTNSKGQLTMDPMVKQLQGAGISHVQVETKDGSQIVSLQTAEKSYRDQLAKGTAVIESGPYAGSAISDHYTPEVNFQGPSTVNSKARNTTFDKKTMASLSKMGLTDKEMTQIISESDSGLVTGLAGGSQKQKDKILLSMAQKLQESDASGTSGTITVGLQPNVAKYLQIQTTGNDLLNTAANSGGPPSISSSGSSTNGRTGG